MAWHAEKPALGVFHLLDPSDSPLTVHRVIRGYVPTTDDFRSAYELGHPPPRRLQKKSAPVWMALSTLLTHQAAASRAVAFPVLGTHVAEVVLRGGNGFAVAETVEPGHVSVWGDPLKLVDSVVDVYPVEA